MRKETELKNKKYYNQKLLKENYTIIIGMRGTGKRYAMNKKGEEK